MPSGENAYSVLLKSTSKVALKPHNLHKPLQPRFSLTNFPTGLTTTLGSKLYNAEE